MERRGGSGGPIVFQFLTTLTRAVERKNRKFRGVNDVQRERERERGRVITGCDVGTTRELSRPRCSRLSYPRSSVPCHERWPCASKHFEKLTVAIMTGPRKGSPRKQPDNYNYSGVPGPRYPREDEEPRKNCCRDNFHPINESAIHGCLTSSRSTCLLQGFVLPPPNIPRLPQTSSLFSLLSF